MTGDPVREAVGVFGNESPLRGGNESPLRGGDESPLRGAVCEPPIFGFDSSDIGVPAGRRSIERGVDSALSFFNTIGLSKSEALNRVRMNMRWL